MELKRETLDELRELYTSHSHPDGETCTPSCPIRTLYFGAAGFAAGLVFLDASLAEYNTRRKMEPSPALTDLAAAHPLIFLDASHAQHIGTCMLARGYMEAAGI